MRGRNVVKADEVDIFSFSVFRNFEEVDDAGESRRTRQCGRDIREANLCDRIDFDCAFFHSITSTQFDARMLPNANAAFDVAVAHAIAQAFSEDHRRTFSKGSVPKRQENDHTLSAFYLKIPGTTRHSLASCMGYRLHAKALGQLWIKDAHFRNAYEFLSKHTVCYEIVGAGEHLNICRIHKRSHLTADLTPFLVCH
jgi:hypothetical protein